MIADPAATDLQSDLDVQDALQNLERHARTFHALGRKSREYVLAQGAVIDDVYRDCEIARVKLTHFIPERLGVSLSTARRYRRLWLNKARIEAVEAISPSAAYLLLAPSTPDALAEQLISRVEAGGSLTIADVERELRPARLLEAASIIGHSVLDTPDLTPRQRVTQLRSMTEIADEATERGAVTVDGEDVTLSALFGEAVIEHTEQRQAEHVAAAYAVDLLITGRVNVTDGRVTLVIDDAPPELLSRAGLAIPLVWRERAA